MANYLQAVGASCGSGLGCGCDAKRSVRVRRVVGSTLRGYRAVTLEGLGADTIPPGTPAFLPVSDRKAVAAAIRIFHAQDDARRATGLSDAVQVQGAASLAATGAKLGSMIMPGIGTAIGAVVGAVAGWIMGKKKDPGPTPEERAACTQLLSEYEQAAKQYPEQALPLDLKMISNLRLCAFMVDANRVSVHSINRMNTGFPELLAYCKALVRKVYETPVGAEVVMPETKLPGAGNIGRKPIPEFRFKNEQFVSIWELAERTLIKAEVIRCYDWHGNKGNCESFYGRWIMKRALFELLAYAAREELPNISEADLRAASQVAATMPAGTASAKDVVAAVENIIGKKVESGQTASLLTPNATAPPPATAPPSTTTPTIPVPAGSVPVNVTPPAIPTPPSLPPNASTEQVQAAIAQLTQMFMQTQQAQAMTQQQAVNAAASTAQQWLASQGVQASPGAVKDTATQTITAGAGASNAPMWLGLAALGFALAMPASRGGRRRSFRRKVKS